MARPRGAVADVQKSIGRRLVLVHRGFDAAVGKFSRAGAVVQRLRGRGLRLCLGLQGSQSNGVVQSVLLLLSLLGGHLIQVHCQRVVATHVQNPRRR